jgi:hypothetical protein
MVVRRGASLPFLFRMEGRYALQVLVLHDLKGKRLYIQENGAW